MLLHLSVILGGTALWMLSLKVLTWLLEPMLQRMFPPRGPRVHVFDAEAVIRDMARKGRAREAREARRS